MSDPLTDLEEDGLGTKLPKDFVLKISGVCKESKYHTKRFGYTVCCPIEKTHDIRTGDSRPIKLSNTGDDDGKSFVSNGIHHWAWRGNQLYCFPDPEVCNDEKISEMFPPGSVMKIELLDDDDDDVYSTGSNTDPLEEGVCEDKPSEEEEEDPDRVVPDTDGKLHVFLVGNSYTRQNDLTSVVKGVFHAVQGNRSVFSSSCPPGQSWNGHYQGLIGQTGSRAAKHFHQAMTNQKNRQWNWVILQNQSQQPAYIEENPDFFNGTVQDCKNIYKYIQEHNKGVRVMFYLTWGRCGRNTDPNPPMFTDYLTNQKQLIAGYKKYREETTTDEWPTYIAPVGLVHQRIYQDLVDDEGVEDPTADGTLFRELYWRDRHHPSLLGTYVAAMTIFASITGKIDDDETFGNWIPTPNPKSGEKEIEPEVAAILRRAVVKTIKETAESGLIQYPWQ